MLRNIQAHPLAAATLVQLLRHNSRASIEDGLLAESLAYAMLQGSQEFRHFLAGRGTPIRNDDEYPLLITRLGNILDITLNRPEKRNAYSAAMRDALYEALSFLAADSSLERAEVRGEGGCFCIGGDLEEFGLSTDTAQAHLIRMSRPVGLMISQLADRIEFHVHRACIGSGIELPAFAKRVTATADTFFQLPEITMGLIPGAGGTVSILRRIGRQRMAQWALSARRIKAATALEWGLIDAVV
ncbi:enoyl-CoA hydratase/isomerase family protein [Denitratisoma oestradiolicum]|nr:enoyl-CoA hydratase/isomerase family protein [Denitratisoma oestradiolicum]